MPTYKFQARKGTPLHRVMPPGDIQHWLKRRGYEMQRMIAQPRVLHVYIMTDKPFDRDTKQEIHERYGYTVTEEGQSVIRRLQFWRD